MIIDGHAHASGDLLTPDSIVRTLDRAGVDKVILVPGETGKSANYCLPDIARLLPKRNVTKAFNILTKAIVMHLSNASQQLAEANAYVHRLHQQVPERVIQFYLVSDAEVNTAQELEVRWDGWGFRGLKIHQCWYRIPVDSALFRAAASWAESKGLPVFIHLGTDKEVRKLIAYKERHPRLKIIVGHLFGLEMLLRSKIPLSNLWVDISTYQVTSDRRVLQAIEGLGAERVVFGSDSPYGKDNIVRNIERVRRLPISQLEKDRILGLNLQELLGL